MIPRIGTLARRIRKLCRLFSWAGALLAVAVLSIWVITWKWGITRSGRPTPPSIVIWISDGTLGFKVIRAVGTTTIQGATPASWRLETRSWEDRVTGKQPFVWWFRYDSSSFSSLRITSVDVPLWSLAISLGVGSLVAWRCTRMLPDHLCRSCQYDLTGLKVAICPECGAVVD